MEDSFFLHSIVGVGMNRDGFGWALGRLNRVDQMVDRTYMVYMSVISFHREVFLHRQSKVANGAKSLSSKQ